MASSPLETLTTLRAPLGEKDIPVLRQAIDTMARFSEECLQAAGTAAAEPLQAALNKAFLAVQALTTCHGVSSSRTAWHFSTIHDDYWKHKAEARRTLNITREDPRTAQTRAIADQCATVHARLLALVESITAPAALQNDRAAAPPSPAPADDCSFELGLKAPQNDDLEFPLPDDPIEDL